MTFKKSFLAAVTLLAVSQSAFATIVAVADSGVDFGHEKLKDQMYVDEFGENLNWNFYANKKETFDYEYAKRFDENAHHYLRYSMLSLYYQNHKISLFTDDDWNFEKNILFPNNGDEADQTIVDNGVAFGTFAHGTHVAGIIAQYPNNQIVDLKFIASYPGDEEYSWTDSSSDNDDDEDDFDYIEFDPETGLLTPKSMAALKEDVHNDLVIPLCEDYEALVSYVAKHNIPVVNASLGSEMKQYVEVLDYGISEMTEAGIELKESDNAEIYKFYVEDIKNHLKNIFETIAPNSLFVLAAGNESDDTDKVLKVPSCAHAANMIVVGSDWVQHGASKFSNFGETSVDIFAYGELILSTVPGGMGHMSGTSQATPQVSRTAGRMLDVNNKLTIAEVKKIILNTFDKHPFLTTICATGGMLNEERAVLAAQLMIDEEMNIDDAIAQANEEIGRYVYEQPIVKSANSDVLSSMIRSLETRAKDLPIPFITK